MAEGPDILRVRRRRKAAVVGSHRKEKAEGRLRKAAAEGSPRMAMAEGSLHKVAVAGSHRKEAAGGIAAVHTTARSVRLHPAGLEATAPQEARRQDQPEIPRTRPAAAQQPRVLATATKALDGVALAVRGMMAETAGRSRQGENC